MKTIQEHEALPLPDYIDPRDETARAIAGTSYAEMLAALGHDPDAQLTIEENWYRGGSETYVLRFGVSDEGEGDRHQYIAKACVKSFPTASMAEWLNRRALMATHNVATPALYLVNRATLIEDHIPYSLREAYRQATPDGRTLLEQNFHQTYATVARLGFSLNGDPYDLRSNGTDVVWIDFGEDLGPSSVRFEPPETVSEKARAAFARLI